MEGYLSLETDLASTTAAVVTLLMDEEATARADDGATGFPYWDNTTGVEAYDVFTPPPKRDSLLIVVPVTILYTVIFFTGVVGNFVTCVVIARNKHMHTATNYYLFSLAVSDLLLLVSGLPQEMYSIWSHYPYIFGEMFCVLRGFAAETSTNASVLTITAFTVERYVAICHPFLSHTMSRLSRAVKFVVGIWLVAMASAVPLAMQLGLVRDPRHDELVQCSVARELFRNAFEVSTFLFFVAPMTLITVLYALIGLRLRRSGLQRGSGSFGKKRATAASASASSRADLAAKRSCSGRHQPGQSKKVLKMLVAVVVAFFICWAPFHAQRLFATLSAKTSFSLPVMKVIYHIVTYVSGILYYVSTTINPILYHIMSLKFREAFKDTLARCCGVRARRRRRSYSVLSRSAHQRCLPAACAAPSGQESTDYSGNSVREEYLATAVTTSGGGRTGRSAGGGSVRTDSVEFRRCYSVVVAVAAAQGAEVRAGALPPYDRQDTQSSQKALLSSRRRRRRGDGDGASLLWKVLGCVSRPGDPASRRSATASLAYAPAAAAAAPGGGGGESFNLLPVVMCHSASDHNVATSNNSNNVSNSSLRDVERGALEDELTTYMEELHRRQRC
ncbi:pyrokinin-1 receptor-like [Bacillus rossius redtenbacheri]|uniref:pyrokinin-1 receptor-like n=1 Tax=Bacillus rossius redtenbacheri TaxID=93214 RepID=UPI002FDCA23B